MIKKLTSITLLLTAVSALASLVPRAPQGISKLDTALSAAARLPDSQRLRVLVRTEHGQAENVGRCASVAGIGTSWPLTDSLLVMELASSDLLRLATDSDVTGVSLDAPVRTSGGGSLLSQNVLLDTEGLLAQSGNGVTRTFPYTGRNIGIAIVDSGIRPNANLNLIATYDFLASNGKKVSANDPFGHGTHVAGIATSNGTTSSKQYEAIAPAARLYAFRALAANGSGYTSNVINANNFAVRNKTTLGIDIINLSLGS
jgi:subtilisin family serine protease